MVGEPPALVELLQRRRAILAQLRDSAATRADITAAIEASKTTVTRALWELQTAQLVDRDGQEYSLTTTGRVVTDEFATVNDDVADIAAAAPLLERIDDATAIEPRALIGSTVYVAEPPTPSAPVNAVADLFEGSNRVRIGSQAYTNARFPEQQTQLAVEDRAATEIIFEEQVYETARRDFPGMLEKNVREGDVRIYTIESLPFAAGCFEHDDVTWAVLVVYDDSASIVGSLVNDSPAAVEWVNEIFERWRERATEVTAELEM